MTKRGRPINQIKRDVIFALLKKGWKNKDISRELKRTKQLVNYYKKLSTGGLESKKNKK